MAMTLFAHVLRGATPGEERGEALAARSLDLRRWVFRELVVRRVDLAAWGLAHWPQSVRAAVERREPTPEPLWADTQPWCHE